MTKLDPEFKAKWCEALRSGKYKQGYGKLRPSSTTHCCLGVAVALHDPENYSAYKNYVSFETAFGLPHAAAQELWSMNDSEKYSFSEIADYIEANL